MSILEGLGPAKRTYSAEEFVEKKEEISPFAFIDDINHTQKNLIVDEWSERQYNPYIINKGLSFNRSTILQANMMNGRSHLPKALQNQFLLSTIRPEKRFNKWFKRSDNSSIAVIKEYYGYSTEKAETILPLLTDEQIQYMRNRLTKGGL